jgi:hypothetical protein
VNIFTQEKEMQTSPGQRIKHALAFILLVVIITINLEHMADSSAAPVNTGWTIQANATGVSFSTFGQKNKEQQFGIIQQHGRCNAPQLLLTIASDQDGFESFVGQTASLHIQMGKHSGIIEVPIIDVVQASANTQLAVLSNFVLNEHWLEDLGSHAQLKVEILSPVSLYTSSNNDRETFDLSGYKAMSSLAKLRCKNALAKTANDYQSIHSIFSDAIFFSV